MNAAQSQEYAIPNSQPTQPPPERKADECGKCHWQFGRIIRVRKHDNSGSYWREAMVLYGSGIRVYRLEIECPDCRETFYFNGKIER